VRLGDGDPLALSPDGRWVLARSASDPTHLILLPTGPGTPSPLVRGGFAEIRGGGFLSDRTIWFNARTPGGGWRPYAQEIAGNAPRALLAEGTRMIVVSPDERNAIVWTNRAGRSSRFLVSLEGGAETSLPHLKEEEMPVRWSGDGKYFFASRWGENALEIHRLDPSSGRREPWKRIAMPEPIEPYDIRVVVMSSDGSSVVYAYQRYQSHLFLLEGLR
jgi:Tol biopolymer transport system component